MAFQTSQGFASRAGHYLGVAMRFSLHDRNPKLKWIKRTLSLALVVMVFAQIGYWIAGALLSLGCAGLVMWGLAKSDVANVVEGYVPHETDYEEPIDQEGEEGMWRDGPEGWGYYRVDDVRLDF